MTPKTDAAAPRAIAYTAATKDVEGSKPGEIKTTANARVLTMRTEDQQIPHDDGPFWTFIADRYNGGQPITDPAERAALLKDPGLAKAHAQWTAPAKKGEGPRRIEFPLEIAIPQDSFRKSDAKPASTESKKAPSDPPPAKAKTDIAADPIPPSLWSELETHATPAQIAPAREAYDRFTAARATLAKDPVKNKEAIAKLDAAIAPLKNTISFLAFQNIPAEKLLTDAKTLMDATVEAEQPASKPKSTKAATVDAGAKPGDIEVKLDPADIAMVKDKMSSLESAPLFALPLNENQRQEILAAGRAAITPPTTVAKLEKVKALLVPLGTTGDADKAVAKIQSYIDKATGSVAPTGTEKAGSANKDQTLRHSGVMSTNQKDASSPLVVTVGDIGKANRSEWFTQLVAKTYSVDPADVPELIAATPQLKTAHAKWMKATGKTDLSLPSDVFKPAGETNAAAAPSDAPPEAPTNLTPNTTAPNALGFDPTKPLEGQAKPGLALDVNAINAMGLGTLEPSGEPGISLAKFTPNVPPAQRTEEAFIDFVTKAYPGLSKEAARAQVAASRGFLNAWKAGEAFELPTIRAADMTSLLEVAPGVFRSAWLDSSGNTDAKGMIYLQSDPTQAPLVVDRPAYPDGTTLVAWKVSPGLKGVDFKLSNGQTIHVDGRPLNEQAPSTPPFPALPKQLEDKEGRAKLSELERSAATAPLLQALGVDADPAKFLENRAYVYGVQQLVGIKVPDGLWGPETQSKVDEYIKAHNGDVSAFKPACDKALVQAKAQNEVLQASIKEAIKARMKEGDGDHSTWWSTGDGAKTNDPQARAAFEKAVYDQIANRLQHAKPGETWQTITKDVMDGNDPVIKEKYQSMTREKETTKGLGKQVDGLVAKSHNGADWKDGYSDQKYHDALKKKADELAKSGAPNAAEELEKEGKRLMLENLSPGVKAQIDTAVTTVVGWGDKDSKTFWGKNGQSNDDGARESFEKGLRDYVSMRLARGDQFEDIKKALTRGDEHADRDPILRKLYDDHTSKKPAPPTAKPSPPKEPSPSPGKRGSM